MWRGEIWEKERREGGAEGAESVWVRGVGVGNVL